MALRIVMGGGHRSHAEHAQMMVRKIEALQERSPHHHPRPKGIALHQAVYPSLCEDCGETYWSREEWTNHIGCRGVRTKGAGF